MIRFRKARSRARRSATGTRLQAACAARACATICGNAAGDVFSKYPSVSPVAGFIEGRGSTEMAVAAINGFYMKTSRNRRTEHEQYSVTLQTKPEERRRLPQRLL